MIYTARVTTMPGNIIIQLHCSSYSYDDLHQHAKQTERPHMLHAAH